MSKFSSNEVVLARKPTMNNFKKATIYEYNHDNSLVKIKWIESNKYEWIINNPLHIKSIDKISSLTTESPNKRRKLSSDNSIVEDVNIYKSDKTATVINVNTSNALKSNDEIITTPNDNKSNNLITFSSIKSKKKPIISKESVETKSFSTSKERTSLLNKSDLIDLTQIDEIYEKSSNQSNGLVRSSIKSSNLNDTSMTIQVEDDVNYFSIEDTIFYSNAISKDKNKVDDSASIDNSFSECRRSSNSIDNNDSNKRSKSSKSEETINVSKNSSNTDRIDDDYIDSEVESITESNDSISENDFDSDSESDNVKVTNKSLKNSIESTGISKKECADIVKVGEATLSKHCDILKPFVKPDIYNKLLKNRNEHPIFRTLDKVTTQPSTISSKYAMRSYQIEGLNWLISQYYRGINSILADEMGLGKTFQTIAFITYLLHLNHEKGPHLVVCPLSVLQNWIIEFRKFSPSIKVLRLHGSGEENSEINRLKVIAADYKKTEVIICTYDTLKKGKFFGFLKKFIWRTVTLDEGHRIKNDSSLAWSRCSALLTRFKLILTGTPVQNNLHEMYSILNFLMPTIFTDSIPFDNSFQWNSDENKAIIDRDMLDKSHYLLRVFILRRLKNEVENTLPEKIETKINCPMSKMQQFWMKQLLLKEKDIIINSLGDKTHNNRLFNLMMHLRKVSNHPYLFRGVELISSDGMPTEEIITASGKMIVLDKLLKKLIEKKHRVVIFSQFTRTLDIISDYLDYRNYNHCRLDGSTSRVMREVNINLFNKPESELQVFCLTTRAGGEGVNLYTADTAILFDSDWNPQVDIQAMARIHRIGQTKVVHVYRLITTGSVEEIILHRAQNKMFLDAMVNRGSTAQGIKLDETNLGDDLNDTDDDVKNDDIDSENVEIPSEDEVNDGTIEPSKLLSAIKFGWNNVFSLSDSSNLQDQTISDEDIELIIGRNRNNESDSKENDEKLSKLLQNQEKTINNFDESVGLVSIKDIESEFIKKNPKDITLDSIANDWRNITKPTNEVINNSDIMGSFSTKSGRQIASRDFENQDFCQNCWEGGDLICCDFCPTSFHLKCLKEIKLPPPTDGPWKCSHHDCRKCFKKKGNFLFRCEICVDAYCETCLPVDASVKGPSKFFEALGFRTPNSACYILCSLECIDFANTRANDIIAEIYNNDESDNKIHKKTITTNYRTIIPTLDPVVVVEKCLLKDVKTRLTRYIDSSNAKFQSLKEIPNFEIRLRKAMSSTVALLNSLIQQIKKKLNKNYSGDLESVDILDTIMNFEGLPHTCEYEYIAEVFLDIARALRNAVKTDLFGIIKIIGINEPVAIFNNRHKRIDEIELDEIEPKFRYQISDSAKRALVEEAIASFLVILHPQNLLIELSPSSSSLPFSIDSLFYVFRLLQCLGEYSTDHQFMIATNVLRQNGKVYDKLREFKPIRLTKDITVDDINKWTEPARRLCKCLTERELESVPKKIIKEIMEIKKPKPVAVVVEPVKEVPKLESLEDKPVLVEEVKSEINNQNELWKTSLNKSSRLFIMKAFKAYIRSLISINKQHENSMLNLVTTIDGLEKTHLINSKTIGAYINIYNIMTLVHTILESKFDISYPKNLKYLSYDTLNEFAKQISEYFKNNLNSSVNDSELSIESKLITNPNVESTNLNDNNDNTIATSVLSTTTNNKNKNSSVDSVDWRSNISTALKIKVKAIILYSLQLIQSLNITFKFNEKTLSFIEESYLKNCSSVEIYSHSQHLMNYLCLFYSNNLPKNFKSIKLSQLSNFIMAKKGKQFISNNGSISPIVVADRETSVSKNVTLKNNSVTGKDIANYISSTANTIDLTEAKNTKIIPISSNKQQVLKAFNQYIKLVSYNNYEWSKIYNDALIESLVKWLEKDHLSKCNSLTEYLDITRIAEFAERFIKENLQHKNVKFPSLSIFTNLLNGVVENKNSRSDNDIIVSNQSDQIPFETNESTPKTSNSQIITNIHSTTSQIPAKVIDQLVTSNIRLMPITASNQSNPVTASRVMPTTSEPLAISKQPIVIPPQIPTTSMISVTTNSLNQSIADKNKDISIPNVKVSVQSTSTQSNEGKYTESNEIQKTLDISLSVVKRAPIICKITEIITNFLKSRYIQLSDDLTDNIVLQIDLTLLKSAKSLEEYVSMKTIHQRVLKSFHSFIRQGNGHLFNIDQLNKIIQGLNDTDNSESIEVQENKSSTSENIDNDSIYPFTNPINVNIRREILFTLWSYPHYRSNYTYECLLNIVDSLDDIEDKNNFKWKRNITQDVRSYLVNNIIYIMMIQKAVQYNVLCSNPANCSVIFESNLFKYTNNLYIYLNVNKISELITSIMIYYAYDLKDQSIKFVSTNYSDKILSSTIDSFNMHGCAFVKNSSTLTNMTVMAPADSINMPFDSIVSPSFYTGNISNIGMKLQKDNRVINRSSNNVTSLSARISPSINASLSNFDAPSSGSSVNLINSTSYKKIKPINSVFDT